MNSSTSGISPGSAGRMVMASGMGSTGALQSLGDAADAREQRREQLAVLAAARAPALQQVHLHEIHGIEVGVAQADGALHGRIEVEQLAAVADGEHLRARPLVLGAQLPGVVTELLRRERIVVVRDIEV